MKINDRIDTTTPGGTCSSIPKSKITTDHSTEDHFEVGIELSQEETQRLDALAAAMKVDSTRVAENLLNLSLILMMTSSDEHN